MCSVQLILSCRITGACGITFPHVNAVLLQRPDFSTFTGSSIDE